MSNGRRGRPAFRTPSDSEEEEDPAVRMTFIRRDDALQKHIAIAMRHHRLFKLDKTHPTPLFHPLSVQSRRRTGPGKHGHSRALSPVHRKRRGASVGREWSVPAARPLFPPKKPKYALQSVTAVSALFFGVLGRYHDMSLVLCPHCAHAPTNQD